MPTAYTHQPVKRQRAGRLANQTRAEHVEDMAEKYAAAAKRAGVRADVRVIDGAIYINGARYRLGDVGRMTRELRNRCQSVPVFLLS